MGGFRLGRPAEPEASGRFRAADSEFEQLGTERQTRMPVEPTRGRPWSTQGRT